MAGGRYHAALGPSPEFWVSGRRVAKRIGVGAAPSGSARW